MKQTPFAAIHEGLGAKMLSFAGYSMPLQYEGITAEHDAVRSAVGVFDVSHMGEFIIRGPRALELIQYVSSNDAAALHDGKVQYSCLPNEEGGIVDDLLVYRINAETYMLVVNAANIEKDWKHIASCNRFGAEMVDISEKTSLLAVQGPLAAEALQPLTEMDLKGMEYYSFLKGRLAGVDNVLVSATGYTGAGGFELYFAKEHSAHIWKEIFAAGEPFGMKPAGLGARDTLRLEMGFCLYGNDIDDHTSPLEAGLGWITRFTKDFVGAGKLQQQKEQGIGRRLVGFELLERGIPRQGYEICDEAGKIIGKVTSGTQSPSLKKGIGLGYVETPHAPAGTTVYIMIRDKALPARVVKLPFYNKNLNL